jgi:hypothetical protein
MGGPSQNGYSKPSYYNSQNSEKNISNNNSYYNNNNTNTNNTNSGTNSNNSFKERPKYENHTNNNFTNSNFSNNNANYSSGNNTERKVFKNSQPRSIQDINQDPSIDISSPTKELTRKVFVGEISKTVSLENDKINPPKNQYLEKDLDIKYSQSHSGTANAKTSRNYEPNYNNKKTESNTPSSSLNTAKYDDIQKPVFTSKKIEEGSSNFVEIKQDGDVIISN